MSGRSKSTPWRSAAECAEVARVSARRIHRAIREGELRAAVVDARGTRRIHDSWLFQWLEGLADRHPADHQHAVDVLHDDAATGGRAA